LAGGLRIVDALDAAESTYARGLAIHPGDCWLNHELAQLIADRGHERTQEALEHAFAALGSCGGTWGARHLLGGLFQRDKRFEDALAQFEALARDVPDDGHIRAHIAGCLLDLRRGRESLESVRRALELAPDDAQAWHVLARIELSRGRRRAQLEAARRCVEADPQSIAMSQALGKSLFFTDLVEEALPLYERFLVQDVDSVTSEEERLEESDHWLKYGLMLSRIGDHAAGAEALRTALRFDPSNPYAHCNLAMALEEAGDFAGARTHYLRGHELGSARPNWSFPTEAWAESAERLQNLASHFEAFENAEWQPDADLDAYLFAVAAGRSQHHRLAVRAYEAALVQVPHLAAEAGAEYRRSLASSAAAASLLEDLDDAERIAHARRALDWLNEEHEHWRALLSDDPKGSYRTALSVLRTMQLHRSYAHLREDAQLAELRAKGPEWAASAARATELWAAIDATVDAIVELELASEASQD
jgi:tetratricopeptide (TPR) repeat protein